MDDVFNIRYMKLFFKLKMESGGFLPKYKVSMLRGGIGEMLLRANCIADRNCENCSFSEECNVQRIYYHSPKIQPEFMQERSGIGYLYECDDYREGYRAGDTLEFSMLLLGDLIAHFPLILQALTYLGAQGIGKNELRFTISSIQNHRGETILQGHDVMLGYLQPDYLLDYINDRWVDSGKFLKINFVTPWTQKYNGEFIREFVPEAFSDAVYRRVYLMNCLEGSQMSSFNGFRDKLTLTEQYVDKMSITRFSSTHNEKINLKGIIGSFILEDVPDEFMPFLYAAELLHVGKNTSMGFGKFIIGG